MCLSLCGNAQFNISPCFALPLTVCMFVCESEVREATLDALHVYNPCTTGR